MLGDTHNHMSRLNGVKHSTYMEHYAFLCSRGTLKGGTQRFQYGFNQDLALTGSHVLSQGHMRNKYPDFLLSIFSSNSNIIHPHNRHTLDLL